MRIGITTNDDRGLDSEVSAHFGQCKYFCVVELNGNKIKEAKVAQNTAVHGGGGCQAVDEMMKHGVTHVIAGGMGMGAQGKFSAAGIQVFGYSGNVKAAVEDLIKNKLGGLAGCPGHEGGCH
jgi:predicted Fe-Mo cluster-binding NifX family protein